MASLVRITRADHLLDAARLAVTFFCVFAIAFALRFAM